MLSDLQLHKFIDLLHKLQYNDMIQATPWCDPPTLKPIELLLEVEWTNSIQAKLSSSWVQIQHSFQAPSSCPSSISATQSKPLAQSPHLQLNPIESTSFLSYPQSRPSSLKHTISLIVMCTQYFHTWCIYQNAKYI